MFSVCCIPRPTFGHNLIIEYTYFFLPRIRRPNLFYTTLYTFCGGRLLFWKLRCLLELNVQPTAWQHVNLSLSVTREANLSYPDLQNDRRNFLERRIMMNQFSIFLKTKKSKRRSGTAIFCVNRYSRNFPRGLSFRIKKTFSKWKYYKSPFCDFFPKLFRSEKHPQCRKYTKWRPFKLENVFWKLKTRKTKHWTQNRQLSLVT